jgi:hypothetical protein
MLAAGTINVLTGWSLSKKSSRKTLTIISPNLIEEDKSCETIGFPKEEY